jgi:hypothetical protein
MMGARKDKRMLRWARRLFRRETEEDALAEAELTVLEHEEKSAEALYYEVASKKLDFQFQINQRIETRAATQFTIGSTILPITAGFLTSGNNPLDDSLVGRIALLLSFVFYLLQVFFFVWSYRINKWDSRPDPPQWKEVTSGRAEEEMHRWLGNACVEAYAANEPVIERKASKIGAALWFLAGEASSLTVAVLAPLWPIW